MGGRSVWPGLPWQLLIASTYSLLFALSCPAALSSSVWAPVQPPLTPPHLFILVFLGCQPCWSHRTGPPLLLVAQHHPLLVFGFDVADKGELLQPRGNILWYPCGIEQMSALKSAHAVGEVASTEESNLRR